MGFFGLFKKKEPFSFVPDTAPLSKYMGKDPIIERIDLLEKSLKEHVSAETAKVSNQIAGIFATEMKPVIDKIETIPAETKKEIEFLLTQLARSRTPLAVRTVTEEISKRVTNALSDMIDTALLAIIQEKGKITNAAILDTAIKRGICSRASVFRHLSKLEDKGKIKRMEDGRLVYYTLIENQQQSQQGETKEIAVSATNLNSTDTST